jgi:hypothetical protein
MMNERIKELAEQAGLAEWHESIQQYGFKFASPENLERFATLVRAKREWVDLTDDEKVMLSDRLNLDRRIVVIDAVIAAFKEKNK